MATGTVITVDEQRRIITDAAVAVDNGCIVAVGKAKDLEGAFSPSTLLGGPHELVIPGLVNTHQHLTGDGLIRSAIPDTAGMDQAIFDWVMPVHEAHEPEDDLLTALLGLAQSLLAGVTTTVEAGTVAHPEKVIEAFRLIGARGVVGTWGLDNRDVAFALPWQQVLERQSTVIDACRSEPLVDGWVTLVGHDLMSDELVIGASQLAAERSVGLSFHISPGIADADSYRARTGRRPINHLQELGALGSHVLLAHAVHLDDTELETLVESGAAVAYCPWAYLRLAQGVTSAGRHLEMVERGVRVGLGCDALNASDTIDLLLTARLAAGLARDRTGQPERFGAHDAFAMATIGGAEALGWADRIGSIEVGKRADLVLIDRGGVGWQPWSPDPVLQLVWGADGSSVTDVVVDGRVVVKDRTVVTVDLPELIKSAQSRSRRLLERAGVSPKSRWLIV